MVLIDTLPADHHARRHIPGSQNACVDVLEGGISAEAHLDIDRTWWNAICGSARFFEHLGMHLVFDLDGIEVRSAAP
jgi:hypothetical protein